MAEDVPVLHRPLTSSNSIAEATPAEELNYQQMMWQQMQPQQAIIDMDANEELVTLPIYVPASRTYATHLVKKASEATKIVRRSSRDPYATAASSFSLLTHLKSVDRTVRKRNSS